MEKFKDFFDMQKIIDFIATHWYLFLIVVALIISTVIITMIIQKTVRRKKSKVLFFTIENDLSNKSFDCAIVDKVVFGRADFCDVIVEDSKMSRYHFCIQKEKKKYTITDLESTNGTYLNGLKLNEKKTLQNKDRIFAGTTTLTIAFQE